MPKGKPKVRRRADVPSDAVGQIAQFFASGGRIVPTLPWVEWTPFVRGAELRADWEIARAVVRRSVPREAFDLMESEFGQGGRARSFTKWLPAERERLALALGVPTERQLCAQIAAHANACSAAVHPQDEHDDEEHAGDG